MGALVGVAVAIVVLCVAGFAVRGLARNAKHEDGDQVFEDYWAERSGPDGGPR